MDYDKMERQLRFEERMHRYWHKAFCISMFFHGMISFPVLIAILAAAIRGLF